jgi:hypothetical protein
VPFPPDEVVLPPVAPVPPPSLLVPPDAELVVVAPPLPEAELEVVSLPSSPLQAAARAMMESAPR